MPSRGSTAVPGPGTAQPSSSGSPACGPIATTSVPPLRSFAGCADRAGRSDGPEGGVAKYLLDSDVVIDWLRRVEHVVGWVKSRDAAGDFLAWTPVSVAEIHAGLRPREEFVMPDLLRVLHCLPLDDRVGRKAGR